MASPHSFVDPHHSGSSSTAPPTFITPPTSPVLDASVICNTCQSDRFLVYERITPVPAQGTEPAYWDVESWCGFCEEFQGVRTSRPPARPHTVLQRNYGTTT